MDRRRQAATNTKVVLESTARTAQKRLRSFADPDVAAKHCRTMPRTMLRYAIERFPEQQRGTYLKGTVPKTKKAMTVGRLAGGG